MSLLSYIGGDSKRSGPSAPFIDVVLEAGRRDVCIGIRGRRNPCDVFDGLRLRVHYVMAFFLHWYCPVSRPCRVLDPTCGRRNYSFSPLKPRMYSEGVEYFDGDIMPYGSFQADVFKLPFRDGSFDVVFYDPPFMPPIRADMRAEDYGIAVPQTVAGIRRYYSRDVLEELARVTRPGGVVIVKGGDFYYPPGSKILYLFIPDILDVRNIPKQLTLEARYIYRFYRDDVFRLERVRLSVDRPLITQTHYVVLRKKQ